ncbi:ACP S-malonyltransferase [Marinimicrobium agarilyticum]|uniref:ACP S-malonyltransferase n=1 Tax=Marinimicrobium agarilyticum TaxID=306546 RepID=UPI00041BD961|nr:ACP S-malonyltransferase [Marinimicrobium agarilyticum]
MSESSLAFVFPGQGSQKVGMLADLAAEYSQVTETFSEASTVLGYDLWELVQKGPQEQLNLTERTQPLLLAASVAVWRVWQAQNGAPRPAFLAGHSLGEWSALVAAGVVDFADAVSLVQQRGKLMQEAVPAGQGGMAAIIGLDDADIIEACERGAEGEVVVPVNFNSPGQVVIAGASAAVDRAMALCKTAGAKRALALPVSAPFHTALMRPAADGLAPKIESTEFRAPAIPVVHNANADTESDPQAIKRLMIEQIYSPVLWVDCVRTLLGRGVNTVVECGPGKVLSGLNKRIDKSLNTLSIETPDELRAVLQQVRGE